jgi:hypothetical protein
MVTVLPGVLPNAMIVDVPIPVPEHPIPPAPWRTMAGSEIVMEPLLTTKPPTDGGTPAVQHFLDLSQ